MWERRRVYQRTGSISLTATVACLGTISIEAQQAPQKQAPQQKGYTYVVPFEQIPPAPALTAEQALTTFTLHEDFEITVAASDPMIWAQHPEPTR